MGKRRSKAGGGGLKWVSAALALLLASPAGATAVDRWSTHIEEASRRFGVPEGWIRRVMQAESGGRTMLAGKPITSRSGAMGLMQLMPGTWAEMRRAHGLGPDPHDPRDNILAGTAYLRAMHDRFGYPGLFAAYNAGPGRYARHVAAGAPLPAETVAYVADVAGGGAGERPYHVRPARLAPPLFAVLKVAGPGTGGSGPEAVGGTPGALFVPLRGAAPR
jgi:soluble lytic murein transglycosylase-like protein